MRTPTNKTWLGIGIVTAALLLASSAATSPVVAAAAVSSVHGTATDARSRRHVRVRHCTRAGTAAPRYYDRPVNYAPAYPPGPFVLFTPFFEGTGIRTIDAGSGQADCNWFKY
jgi:hypothetical protein